MKKNIEIFGIAFAVILFIFTLVSCEGGGGLSAGTLELSLIDSPSPYQAIYVTLNQVQVHNETDGWITLSDLDLDLPKTINLLDLVNGTILYLGAAELDAGHYDQMRLILEDSEETPIPGELNILGHAHPYYNYLIDGDDNEILLKVPSGGNSGIKLVGGFDIEFSNATELILDFDALKSVVQAGKSGKWLLKPVIKVVETVSNSVSGMVLNQEDSLGLAGAKVSAQEYFENSSLTDEAERVQAAAGTESDELGNYFMYLPLLSVTDAPYNIVATREGFSPACSQLPSNTTGAYTADLILTPLAGDPATLEATVTGLADGEASAHFSIRQTHADCGIIEIASFNVANSMPSEPAVFSDPVSLPAGSYQLVVSAEGQTTKTINLTVIGGVSYSSYVDFTF